MMSFTQILNHHTKNALVKGIAVGGIISVIYLVVVVVTTPSLPPVSAINAAFALNSFIIIGTSAGVGAQIFIASYSKSIGCHLDEKKKKNSKGLIGVASSATTTISSFFSFFSLVPLGSSFSVGLIQYSKPLSYVGLAIVLGFAGLSAFKLQRDLKKMERRKSVQQSKFTS